MKKIDCHRKDGFSPLARHLPTLSLASRLCREQKTNVPNEGCANKAKAGFSAKPSFFSSLMLTSRQRLIEKERTRFRCVASKSCPKTHPSPQTKNPMTMQGGCWRLCLWQRARPSLLLTSRQRLSASLRTTFSIN